MHEAYVPIPILRKLPNGLFIETLTSFGDYLLVGTRSGTLLYYQVLRTPQSDGAKTTAPLKSEYEVKLLSSNKSFSKKNITQIAVVPEFQMLLCLADSSVSAFILDEVNITFAGTVTKTKGAHLFAYNILDHPTVTGEVQHSLRLCVAIKKRLQMYYWKPKAKDLKFVPFGTDLILHDTPRTMVWCEDTLFIGYKTEYRLLKVSSGESHELFTLGGKQQEPLITRLTDKGIAASTDEQTVIIDPYGIPMLDYLIKWSEVPLAQAHDSPYLISVLPSSLEVRSIEPRHHVQNIALENIKLISSSKSGWVFVASQSDLWLLRSVPFTEQISKLLEQNELELALRMAKMVDDKELQKTIQNLHAFSLFRRRQFTEAMEIFLELETDPSHVIGLFPDLLPEEFRNNLEYPDQVPTLIGIELENGLIALASYLVQVRRKLQRDLEDQTSQSKMTAIVEGADTIRSLKQLMQIIDTTLLKCYLQTNEALVASLLRMKDNRCHIEESERALKKHHKYNDLIILYNKKGLHGKALELLMRQAKKPDSPLKGHDRTVSYLQQLDKEHLPLVFKYAEWILKEYPEDGLKIFTDEAVDADHFPKHEVFAYLQKTAPDLVIPYLEHIIHVWKDETPMFHNSLISKYRKKICSLREEYNNSLPEGEPVAKPGEETPELAELHSKLLQFLEKSEYYTVETFAMHLQHDGLFEEAAVVLGRLNRHEEALYIYAHILQDMEKAEEYCAKHYNKNKPSDRDVYFLLLKLYLCMSDVFELCLSSSNMYGSPPPEPNLERALQILTKYYAQIDPSKALSVLPNDVPVSQIKNFLKAVLHNFQNEKHMLKLIKSLLSTENLHVLHQRMQYQSFKLIVSDLDLCRVCQKRIGKSAFAHFPSGVIVHYSCKDSYSPDC